MLEDTYPVRWTGRQAVMTLLEHIEVANAGQISIYPSLDAAIAAGAPAAATGGQEAPPPRAPPASARDLLPSRAKGSPARWGHGARLLSGD